MKLDPTALERATEAYIRELTQRPDQVVGDFVAAIVRAYLRGLPDDDRPSRADLAEDFARNAHYDDIARERLERDRK